MNEKIVILGAGVMGQRISLLCALNGYSVFIWNHRCIENFDARFRKTAILEGRLAGLDRREIDTALSLVKPIESFDKVPDAKAVIECVKEDLGIKIEVLRRAEEAMPAVEFFASNTSALPIIQMASQLHIPGKLLGLHFFNSPLRIKLVEVVVSERTSVTTLEAARLFLQSLNRIPVEVRDSPGMIVNRLLFLMISEAIRMVSSEGFDLKSIDSAMKLGALHPIGPIELADFIGLDVCLSILEELHLQSGDDKFAPPSLLRDLVSQGRLGKKSGSGFYNY